MLTGAKGPAACLSALVTLILIGTIIQRGAASIDSCQGYTLGIKTETTYSLHTYTDQIRSMLTCMVDVEGSASLRIVDSSRRIPVCCKSAAIATQNHHHITANTVTFLLKPKVRMDNSCAYHFSFAIKVLHFFDKEFMRLMCFNGLKHIFQISSSISNM